MSALAGPDTRTGERRFGATEAGEVLGMLEPLLVSMRRLLSAAERKLSALRAGDVGALQAIAAEEGELLEALFRGETQRQGVLAHLAQALPPGVPRPTKVSELADHFTMPFGLQIRRKTGEMRVLLQRLKERNAITGTVAQDLQKHIRAVFEHVRQASQETMVYDANGKHDGRLTQPWVDAVG